MAMRGPVFNDALALPGFRKVTGRAPELTGEQRAALIRKGNELFNRGAVEEAKRIYITTRYGDGLVRVGDHCLAHNDFLEALRMYRLAPDNRKAGRLVEQMAGVVRKWLKEGTDE